MSVEWGIRCLDCNETHEFSAINDSGLEYIRLLIRHRHAIAQLRHLFEEESLSPNFHDIALSSMNGSANVEWFVEHASHRLVPIDDSGSFDDECGERYVCTGCGHRIACHKPNGHEPPHGPRI